MWICMILIFTIADAVSHSSTRDPCKSVQCGVDQVCRPLSSISKCPNPPCAPYECKDLSRGGTCPAVVPEVHPEYGLCNDHCVHDIDCPRVEKCCRSACGGRVCIDPAEKPGLCPSLETSYIGLCVAQCRNDSDCVDAKKCCGGCPRQCVDPINQTEICHSMSCPQGYSCHLSPVICRVSPCSPIASCLITKKPGDGVCPLKPIPESETCLEECDVDGHCPYDQICCAVECHRVCRDPQVDLQKKGRCPNETLDTQNITTPCKPECSIDNDCSAFLKCCGECKRCVLPRLTIKPGKCPKDPFSIFPLIGIKLRCRGKHFCYNDDDCPGSKKCCGVCPKRCRSIVSSNAATKKSKCPTILHVINCRRSRIKKCDFNSDCKKNSMCCPSVTCGKVCVRTIKRKRGWFWG